MLCRNGKAENPAIKDEDCNIDVCKMSAGICNLLAIPGVHTLDEILKNMGSDGSFSYPKISLTDILLRGQWKLGLKLKIGDEIVGHLRVPSDQSWTWIDM
jgi:hypothetical protein